MNTVGQKWKPDALTHRFRVQVNKLGADWSDVSFHMLRHTAASQMALTGRYTLYQIGQFLGHRTSETTRQYAHLMPNQVRPEW